MKTLLEFRIERLEAENDCPCCSTYRAEFLRNPAFFPDSDADAYLFSDGDQVSARYECGSEFVATDQEEIRCRQPCAQASVDAADQLQEQADENCTAAEDAEMAA
ncbi:hypothetical protein PWG15_05300 [Ensifer adhaerens]|uniref:hypothetical protein n=1 Tax=Ensifer adhaerens TaxID=106592 RepID=UPI0023A922CC|nr:hypothetical protein [Ensifer adhaerens]WDZ77921.1 hypothetical protein PWG15_05300 [Ensifer adhaerens]